MNIIKYIRSGLQEKTIRKDYEFHELNEFIRNYEQSNTIMCQHRMADEIRREGTTESQRHRRVGVVDAV